MTEIQNIFVTPIYKTKLKIDNEIIKSFCLNLQKQSKGVIKSNVGGWQSRHLTDKDKPILGLTKEILKHTSNFANELKFNKPNLDLGNMWVNINGYKDFNTMHNHPDALISGVYYINTPKKCGNIKFYHPAYELICYDWIDSTFKEFNDYTASNWWLPAEVGKLYLFPSWLKHVVEPNLNKKEKRISISFNLSYLS